MPSQKRLLTSEQVLISRVCCFSTGYRNGGQKNQVGNNLNQAKVSEEYSCFIELC